MSTAELKSNLYKLIESINDSKTLNTIYALVAKRTKQEADWWDTISEEERASIDEGLAQAERGELIPHDEAMKIIKAKFKK